MISLLLSKPYRAVEPSLSAYLRRYLAEHHKTCADWVPEISEPMFRQLIADSLLRTSFLFGLLMACIIVWAFFDPGIEIARFALGAGVGIAFGLINWRRLSTQCVDREFVYRRQHGKWRWER